MTDATLPKISVVVTCYNSRDYIGDAIRSVARQTLRDFECVIVDDASTDNSVAVIQQTLDELNDAALLARAAGEERRARPAPRAPGSPGRSALRLLPRFRRPVARDVPRAPSRRPSQRDLRGGLHRLQRAADRRHGRADRGHGLLVRQGPRRGRSRPGLRAGRSRARAGARPGEEEGRPGSRRRRTGSTPSGWSTGSGSRPRR